LNSYIVGLDKFAGHRDGVVEYDCEMEEVDDDMECVLLDDDSLAIDDSRKTNQTEDRMNELIGLQKSNGIFEISSKDWTKSVMDFYAGKYEDVKSSCPPGVTLELWITALAIKIMEVKMSDK
jgi:hypothetical protein